MKKGLFLFVLLFSCFSFVFSQESPDSDGMAEDERTAASLDETAEDSVDDILAQDILEMDIRTSSLMELASWCRSLGLSDGGTRDELASRLRRYYDLPAPGVNVSTEGRVIVIESARSTEFFTLDVVDEEYARLRGNVVINLKDGNSVHRIKAWEILYNRTRNIMTASGGVEYVKENEDSIETFKGESITVNLDNWSSIFIDGFTDRSASEGGTAYRFSGTVISRSSEEATVLTGAEITNGKNEDALWSLNAAKLWLLPDADWAVLNAVLKVGDIPVLWLPFFFYPSDEIIFHPVVGYRSREGTFVNTTTYILGRPKSSGFTENSITRIFGGSENTEKVREGLFLRSSGQKTRPSNEVSLSVIFDAYANLGAYLGTELSLPGQGIMGTMDFSFGLGLTRNIYLASYGSTPYKNQDGISGWNSGYIFSLEFPLRYRFETRSSLSLQYASVSWNIPLYSDPYVNRDFLNRSEELDWLSMIREGAGTAPLTETNTGISSYSWTLNGSINPRIPALAPYVSSLSVSNITGSLSFAGRDAKNDVPPGGLPVYPSFPNPDSRFFVPSRLNLSVSASTAGNPFSLGAAAGTSSSSPAGRQEAPGDSLLPALPRQPWEDALSEEESAAGADIYKLEPPVLGQRFTRAQSGGPLLDFDYRISPTGGFEQQFRSNNDWNNAGDINWEVSSRLSRASAAASMGFSLSQSGGSAYSGSFRINSRGDWQDYSYLNENAEEYQSPGRIEAARKSAYNGTRLSSSYDFTSSYAPFYQNPVWGASSIGYDISGLFANYVYDTSSDVTDITNDPRWKWVNGKWNNKDIYTHQVGVNFAANIMDYTQSLSLTSTLWPRDTILTGDAVARAWITQTRIRASIFEPYNDDKREFRPIEITERLGFGSAGFFQAALTYAPEAVKLTNPDPVKEASLTSVSTSLNLFDFSASYSASYAIPFRINQRELPDYDPSLPIGWIQPSGTSRSLSHQNLNFSYSKNYGINNLWNDRLSLNFRLDTGLNFNLQRYTYSAFNFGVVMTAKITNFLDFGLSASSVNSQIYQYFQFLPFFTHEVWFPPGMETNIFKDLINSFRFDNEELRRSSGFKAKAFTLDLVHHLGDWNANLRVNLAPYLSRTGLHPVYKHNYQVSFLIQWVPIEEVKTEFVYEEQKINFK